MPDHRPILYALLLLVCRGGAQTPTVPTIPLGPPTARTTAQFTRIVGMAALRDGRLLVADAGGQELHLVDLARGTDVVVGRHGEGPLEYRGVGAMAVAAGDSVLVFDGAGRRLLVVAPEGTIARAVVLAPQLFAGRTFGPLGGADARGRSYFESAELFAATGQVVRLDARGGEDGIAAPLRLLRTDQAARRALVALPFRDAWAVRSDGLLARVEAETYHVRWYREGRESAAATVLPRTLLRVRGDDIAYVRDSILTKAPRGRAGFGGGANAGQRSPEEVLPDAAFPDVRPSVPSRVSAAWFDPRGRLWVQPERAREDTVPRLDILRAEGGLVARVALPPRSRLLGFDGRHLFLARMDRDDAQWIERYPMPAMP